MVLVVLNLLTVFGVIVACLRSRCGGSRRGPKYEVVSMGKALAEESESEKEQFKKEAI